jgi:hypothetical protein
MMKKYFYVLVYCFLVFFLTACAISPYQVDAKNKSDDLLQKQIELAQTVRANKPQGRLIFAGFAMHSQSKAFRNDVLSAEKSVLQIDPNALIFKLSNPAIGQAADWPFATAENMELVLKKIAALARSDDKVVVLMSTHGNENVLAVNFNNNVLPAVSPKTLNEWLVDLRGKPTILVLSACYSGSFLPAVAGPSRIVLTAAAKNRASFGCNFHSDNTYFIDALFNQKELPNFSIEQAFEQAKITIDVKEKEKKLAPSLPQVFVGVGAKSWSNLPLKNWSTAQ